MRINNHELHIINHIVFCVRSFIWICIQSWKAAIFDDDKLGKLASGIVHRFSSKLLPERRFCLKINWCTFKHLSLLSKIWFELDSIQSSLQELWRAVQNERLFRHWEVETKRLVCQESHLVTKRSLSFKGWQVSVRQIT